jgi:CheY-like chemotaxis protein
MQPEDLRVLVIEDESDSALVIGTAIEYSGAQTWTANSGEAALSLLEEVTPNLLIVDLALPGMDGWTFLDSVRANPATADIPAIVVSAYLTPTVAEKALQAGFVAAIPKPIDTTSLVGQLITILN